MPWLQRYTLPMCLAVLAILTVVNLRGVREAGSAFIAPTYLFVGTLGLVIAIGIFKVIMTGGHPHALVLPPHAPVAAAGTVGLWLLLRAFASGCTALTGVEAVSNGVQAFREPVVPAAREDLDHHRADSGVVLRILGHGAFAFEEARKFGPCNGTREVMLKVTWSPPLATVSTTSIVEVRNSK